MSRSVALQIILLSAAALNGCGGSEEAHQVELPVVVNASGIGTIQTDAGYKVELSEARVAVENFTFALAGEAHTAAVWESVSAWLVPTAEAHPGHYQGGDITGELRGQFLLDWLPGSEERKLGRARLLVGRYKSANFTFAEAAEPSVAEADPILGHTAILRGQASKSAGSVEFLVVIDSPPGRELVGIPFEFEVTKSSTEQLGVRFVPEGSGEGATLFDGLDFLALDADGDGLLTIDPDSQQERIVDAYNLLRRSFQTHDYFDVTAIDEP